MGVVAELIAWLVGDFIPFGDLVSDVLLWRSLPQEKPDTYECSPDAYTIARLALGIGTVVDSIPEVSLLLAITAGVVAALVFGPAYMSTGENKQELAEIASSLWACARHTVTDGKSIVYFVYHDVGETQIALGTIVNSLVWNALVMPHLPALWVLRACCSGSAYYKIIAIQATAGAVTGLFSVFFAIVSGETLAVVSAVFAMYSLLISTLVAIQRGKKAAKEDGQEPELADNIAGFNCTGSATRNIHVYFIRPAYFIGFPVTAFFGLYYLDTGKSVLGKILTAVGFTIWAFLLCYVSVLAGEARRAGKRNTTATKEDCRLVNSGRVTIGAWLFSGGLIMLVVGVYYFITRGGESAKAVSLIATGSALVFCTGLCGISKSHMDKPFYESDWPEHLRRQDTTSHVQAVRNDPHAESIEEAIERRDAAVRVARRRAADEERERAAMREALAKSRAIGTNQVSVASTEPKGTGRVDPAVDEEEGFFESIGASVREWFA